MSILDQFLVYHPAPWVERDWARLSRLPLQEVWFEAGDRTGLFGWYVAPPGSRTTLLWCHGNAGNIINRLENLVELYKHGFSVFLFDYRGYGRSEGRPSEEGLYQDALAAYTYLTDNRRVASEGLVIFGRSLGGAVAAEIASQQPAAGLVLESAFPSVEALAKFHYLGLPVHWLLGARFTLVDRLPRISVPILVIHGDRDDIVPLQLGQQVFDAARDPKTFYLVSGAGHNDLYQVGGTPYFQRLKRFADEVIR